MSTNGKSVSTEAFVNIRTHRLKHKKPSLKVGKLFAIPFIHLDINQSREEAYLQCTRWNEVRVSINRNPSHGMEGKGETNAMKKMTRMELTNSIYVLLY